MDPFDLPARPDEKNYRDLPILGDTEFEDVRAAKSALHDLSLGQFMRPSLLCDAFVTDDRLEGVLQTRLDALASLPLELKAQGDGRRAETVVQSMRDGWEWMLPSDQVSLVRRSGLLMNLGIAEILWDRQPGKWTPRLKWWDSRYAMWRWDTRSYWITTQEGNVEMKPGDGKWLLYTPFGYQRGWMYALARSLVRQFLVRQWGARDWARQSEVHGSPIKKGIVPTNADAEVKRKFINDLRNLGRNTTLQLEQDAESKFDVALMEAQVQSWEGFQKLMEKAEESIAILVLGQNLTTNVKGGGSYAAINVHDRIRLDRLEWDAKSWGTCIREQFVTPYAHFNHGDAGLAPLCQYSTKVPEDRAATAKTLNDLGSALDKLRKAGLNVDREEVAARFNIPLDPTEPLVEPQDLTSPASGAQGGKEEPAEDKAEPTEG